MKKKDEKDTEKDETEPERVVVIDRRPSYESEETAGAEQPRYPTFVEELKARAEKAELRAREISVAYRRIDEERDAFRERLNRDLERRVDIARAELMRKILGVADDLDRAIAVARDMQEPSPMLEGVVLIRDRLMQALASEGVEAFSTVGEPFDPNIAEAMVVEPTEDAGRDNRVLEELQQGYMIKETLLRPARVRVARLQTAASGVADDPPAPEGTKPTPHDP
jgi:molecular chaperone GrpE